MKRKSKGPTLFQDWDDEDHVTTLDPPEPVETPPTTPDPDPIPATTVEAHEAIKPVAATLRARVYNYILNRGEDGATSEETEDGTDISHQTVGPRLRELEQAKPPLIARTQKRRPTKSG